MQTACWPAAQLLGRLHGICIKRWRRRTTMKLQRLVPVFAIGLMMGGASVVRAASAPIVHMRVTLPDGEAKDVAAPESGLATLTLKDGTPIGIRPTIEDSKPWTHVVVTIFATPTTTHASKELGE